MESEVEDLPTPMSPALATPSRRIGDLQSEAEDQPALVPPPMPLVFATPSKPIRQPKSDAEEPSISIPPALATPSRQTGNLNRPFMTPQVRPIFNPAAGRMSLGGGGAQRIRREEPWKVCDIVVPPPTTKDGTPMQNSPTRGGLGRGRESVSESERKVCTSSLCGSKL